MSAYQWKLAIIERNLSLSNWLNLLPEAQERTLQEAEDLIEGLPVPDKQRLIGALEKLHNCTQADIQQTIQQILGTQSNDGKLLTAA